MNLRARSLAYLDSPFAVCDKGLAAELAQAGWVTLAHKTGITAAEYSIANCLEGRGSIPAHRQRLASIRTEQVWLEHPDFQRLQAFYEAHGLEPLEPSALEENQVLGKVEHALALLNRAEDAYAAVGQLVRSIQILQQPHPEIDTSYSHPDIPFSIFVSVCEDASLPSSLRVAESILHEAMHLQLTLLENHLPMVDPASTALYFSPWRDEDRPVRGIMHGMYVFRAIHDFYAVLATEQPYPPETSEFIIYRIESIRSELDSLRYFPQIPDLTAAGKSLAANLIQYGAGKQG